MTLFKNKYRVESTRLKNWNYALAGWYFVTICTANREHLFGQIKDGEMYLSTIGETACVYWQAIPDHSPPNIRLDVFVIMPNHVYGIIVIEDISTGRDVVCNVSTGNTATRPNDNPYSQISPQRGSVGAIMRLYKSAVTRWCGLNQHSAFAWQPRFYDHIIRDADERNRVRAYIRNNPMNWERDRNNLIGQWM